MLQLLLHGLHASGWWGPPAPARGHLGHASDADAPIGPDGTPVQKVEALRRHLLPEAMEKDIVTALRHACYIQASALLPTLQPGVGTLPPPGTDASGALNGTPILEALMLLLPPMYLQVRASPISPISPPFSLTYPKRS